MSRFRIARAGVLFALAVGAGAGASGAPVPAERIKAEKELAALATKLHGVWIGGPCEGRFTFRADGTYEWTHRGPGGDTDAGTWAIRGDAQKPVLVLKCKTSDDSDREGTTAEMKLDRLDEMGFTFKSPESSAPMRFSRGTKELHGP